MSSTPSASSLASSAKSSSVRPAEESISRLSRWSKRWSDNMTGWQKDAPHMYLMKHGGKIIPNFEDGTCEETETPHNESNQFRVFVPLCGKTVDLAFLAEHPSVSQVVGVDGVRKALTVFSDEHPSLEMKDIEPMHAVERMEGNGIILLRGDFFDVNDEMAGGKFDMILDRASIVAIQPDLREKYVNVLGQVLKPGGSILLITIDRRAGTDDAMKTGPPFSINEEEVRRLYDGLDWVEKVEKIDEHDDFEGNDSMREKFASQGLTSLYECVFMITAKKS